MVERKMRLEDFADKLDVEKIRNEKPRIIIVGTVCEGCGEKHPFIVYGDNLHYYSQYVIWHLYRDCDCGTQVFVDHNSPVVYNPYRIKKPEELRKLRKGV